jgi:cation diffusion facilitator family transporter
LRTFSTTRRSLPPATVMPADAHLHQNEHLSRDHERPTGLRARLSNIFAPHSHDAADSIDTALEASERGIRAVRISFAALLATSVLQLVVIVASGSVALLADTVHNFGDALTAIPLFLAFRLARRPPTRRYTYGYGRAEDLAGLFVITMITLSATIAAYEAIRRLMSPEAIDYIGWVALAGIIGFAGNELVAVYRIREGRAIGSAALAADGYHARIDGFTSLAVVLGAIGVWLGFDAADPIAGLVISIAILAVLRNAVVEILRRLMNSVDPQLVDTIEHEAGQTTGVRAVHDIQVRWEGHRLRAELDIGIDPALSVTDAHELAHDVEDALIHHIAHLDTASVHVEPEGSAATTAHSRDHHRGSARDRRPHRDHPEHQ